MANRFFIIFICVFICAATISTQAQIGKTGDLTWNIKNGMLTISGTGKMPIYSDSNIAPWWEQYITAVVIENGVTSIGNSAFKGCSNLTSISIPNSVTSIGKYAFSKCSSLTSINIPNSVKTIGMSAFFSCSSLSSIIIPNSVATIEKSAFYDCSGLTSVTIPNSVTSIGDNIFYGCSSLTSITLEDKVFAIKSSEFNMDFVLDNRNLYSSFAKNYVESKINKWQQKGEYEKTSDWQQRVNETTRQTKAAELLKDAEYIYITERSKDFNIGNMTLISYDPKNETFLIKNSKYGDWLVPVPIDEIPNFKSNWEFSQKTPQYVISNDKLAIAEMEFKLPNDKTYKYSNQASLNYTETKIEYNFAPIDINPINVQRENSDVDINIPTTDVKNDKIFAVIIANEDYQYVSTVAFAKNDGEIFKKYCIQTLGLPEKNVTYITNATLTNIRREVKLTSKIVETYKGEASIIFYYAGHGVPEEKSKMAYLLPIDGEGSDITTSGYKLEELYQELSLASAQMVTVFIDACFSGAQRSTEGEMIVSDRSVREKPNMAAPKGNMIVFSASQNDETACPYKEQSHGMFTYFLLKKLQDTKGNVTFGELGTYITDNVKREALRANRKSQTPTVTPSPKLVETWKNLKLK